MRYRDGLPPGAAELTSTDHMLVLTAVIGLVIGIIMLLGGLYGRQIWLSTWSGGLVIASIVYLVFLLAW